MTLAQRHDEGGDTADPERRAEHVQQARGHQQGAVVQARGRVRRHHGGTEDDGDERGQRPRRGPTAEQQHRQDDGGGDLDQAGEREAGRDQVDDGEIERRLQHGELQQQGCRLAADQEDRAPGAEAGGAADDLDAFRQAMLERAGQQQEEEDTADRHALADDYQAMEDDTQVTENVDQ